MSGLRDLLAIIGAITVIGSVIIGIIAFFSMNTEDIKASTEDEI